MGEIFDNKLSKIQNMKKYSLNKERMLSDMATAYISDSFNGLDESLKAVHSMRRALSAAGYTLQEIDDFLIERSYITKSQINKMFNQSIYNDDNSLIASVECVPAFHTDKSTTDIIIEELERRPALIKALEKGMRVDQIQRDFKVNNSTVLKNFYNAHKDIINID